MVTILLEKILSVLEGWSSSFASFVISLMAKLNLIETETANLPDIKTNTDNISSNTDFMTATLANIKTDTGSISGKVNSIDSNTTIIKNNINTISTNVGTASAFCEDTANNTLEIVDKITTIASDTTQLRTNSNSISSDVSEIKNTLGLYLYNTIVTEDSEGSIANFDTDLKDYLQEAKVDIPADVGGINALNITICSNNLFNEVWESGAFNGTTGLPVNNPAWSRFSSYLKINGLSSIYVYVEGISSDNTAYIFFYDSTGTFINSQTSFTTSRVFTIPNNAYYCKLQYKRTISEINDYNVSVNANSTDTLYHVYTGDNYSVSFTTPITDGAEVDLLSGIVKINTSPVTYDSISPIAIRTFKGINNVYSDIGDISVTYRETLKHYLEKQNS